MQVFYNINKIQKSSINFSNSNQTKNKKEQRKILSPVLKKYLSLNDISNQAQVIQSSKGSSVYVAQQLKQLSGTLDEKIMEAKDIILKDMGLPSDLIKLQDEDLKGTGYAAFMPTSGVIAFDKKMCQNPNADFSDDAVLCILRHELDHAEVLLKLYKKIGKDEFEKLILGSEAMVGALPQEKRVINHQYYSTMSQYVNVDDFNADIYIDAIKNYKVAQLGESHYKNFTAIKQNFNNALEKSAQDKQFELEKRMGVETLADFFSMISETEKLIQEIKAKGITEEDKIQKRFDELYDEAVKSSGFQDKTQNWNKILKEARRLNK